MYIVDNICYAGNPTKEIRIVDAKPLTGMMLLLTFASGERKLFDCTLLTGSAFAPLEDEGIFKNVQVEHGFVSWNNGEIDVAPEYLYDNGITYAEDDDLLLAG